MREGQISLETGGGWNILRGSEKGDSWSGSRGNQGVVQTGCLSYEVTEGIRKSQEDNFFFLTAVSLTESEGLVS